MVQTVYLAGPITQDPDGYVAKFRVAAAVLRRDGFEVLNPVELDDPEHAAEALDEPYGERYEELLARDLAIIEREDVDAVVVLPGWEESKGAWREVLHANALGKPILQYPNLNPAPVYEERCRHRERCTGCTSVACDGAEGVCERAANSSSHVVCGTLPTDSDARKEIPLARGVLDYFPAALAAVAEVSRVGNDKHNPGEPIRHAREKSNDHADCIVRHLFDRGNVDEDGTRHSAKVAWRALALLQEELEEAGAPLARGARTTAA